MDPENIPTLLTIPQAAARLGRDRSTVRTAVERGTLQAAGRIGSANERGGITLITEQAVRNYAQKNGIDMM